MSVDRRRLRRLVSLIYRWFRVLMGWRISRRKDDKGVG